MTNFDRNLTGEELRNIQTILDALNITERRINIIMDLALVHRNICALDLDRMAKCALSDDIHEKLHVIHDLTGITGINGHLDRERGTLERFHPRFAVNQ